MAKTPPFSVCNQFCVGGGGASDSNVKNSDYNQNDPTQPDYIKNRPCYEETTELVSVPSLGANEWEPGWSNGYSFDSSMATDDDSLIIEVNYNGETETQKKKVAEIKKENLIWFDCIKAYIVMRDVGNESSYFHGMEGYETQWSNVGVTIYHNKVKKLPEYYLPTSVTDSVKYIKSDGTFDITNLGSGAYILDGEFVTPKGVTVTFSSQFCQVSISEYDSSNMYFWWQDSIAIHTMQISNGDIVDSADYILPVLASSLKSEDVTGYIPDEIGVDPYIPNAGAVKNYVNRELGDVETALENIIYKYGLGGDA